MDPKIEDNKAEQTKEVETETTQTESPAVKEETTVPQTTEDKTAQQAAPDEPKFQSEEQRKAFQEMRLENKRLKEEITGRRANESAFATFKPQPQLVNPQAYTDPYTGEVNQMAYTNAHIQVAKAEAAQAAREEIDEFQARQKYPDLFADPELEQIVAGQWFTAKMQGENTSITSVADRVSKRLGKVVSKAEKSGMEKALEEVTPKEQAALAASGQTSAPARAEQKVQDWQGLVDVTRKGGSSAEDAIALRLKGIPWANK